MPGLMLGRGWNVNKLVIEPATWSSCAKHSFRSSRCSRGQNGQRSLLSWSLYSSGRTREITKTHRICQVEDDKAELESDKIGCYFRNGLQGKLLWSGDIRAEVTWRKWGQKTGRYWKKRAPGREHNKIEALYSLWQLYFPQDFSQIPWIEYFIISFLISNKFKVIFLCVVLIISFIIFKFVSNF